MVGIGILAFGLVSGAVTASVETALTGAGGIIAGIVVTRLVGAPDSHPKGILILAIFLGPTIVLANGTEPPLGGVWFFSCAIGVLAGRRLGLIAPGSPYSTGQ